MATARVIHNDDFRTAISSDQPALGSPNTAEDMAGLVERAGGTGVTTYVMDAVGFDNKTFFDTQRGVRWNDIDFARYGGNHDKYYGAANRFLDRLRAEGHESLEIVIDSARALDMFRFKIFELTPNDDPPDVWINDTPIPVSLSWRHGPAARDWSWDYGKKDEDLELLAGALIPEVSAPQVMQLLAIAPTRRVEYAQQHDWPIGGPELFMLVEADASAVPRSALRRGVNRLWVRPGERRKDYTFGPAVGEVEIRTVG